VVIGRPAPEDPANILYVSVNFYGALACMAATGQEGGADDARCSD